MNGWIKEEGTNEPNEPCERTKEQPNERIERTKEKKSKGEKVVKEKGDSNCKLTEKQKLFCIFYVKYFNATKAYHKAYGCKYSTALTEGSALKKNSRVSSEIERLKKLRLSEIYIEPGDIFQKYVDIAFADITDYVSFGREIIPIMTEKGPLTYVDEDTREKVRVTRTINTVRFMESDDLDGSILSEVKQGKDGSSIKLADRMKALDWLADHMDLATAEQRARIKLLEKQASIGVVPDGKTGVILMPQILPVEDDNDE